MPTWRRHCGWRTGRHHHDRDTATALELGLSVSGVSRLIAAAELSLGRPDDDPIGQLELMTNIPDGVFRVETDSLEPGFIVRAHSSARSPTPRPKATRSGWTPFMRLRLGLTTMGSRPAFRAGMAPCARRRGVRVAVSPDLISACMPLARAWAMSRPVYAVSRYGRSSGPWR
jgi:hypothetical protein